MLSADEGWRENSPPFTALPVLFVGKLSSLLSQCKPRFIFSVFVKALERRA